MGGVEGGDKGVAGGPCWAWQGACARPWLPAAPAPLARPRSAACGDSVHSEERLRHNLPLPSPHRRPTHPALPPRCTICRDSVDFVQQGALIAMALVLVEQPEARAKPLRDHIDRLYGNKGAEVRGRLFACLLPLLPAAGLAAWCGCWAAAVPLPCRLRACAHAHAQFPFHSCRPH